MEQIVSRRFSWGKPDLRDFQNIDTADPWLSGSDLADVHGVEANIDGLHEAFAKVGGNMRDLLIPVFDELAKRFEAPPADSYIVVMDTLENSFLLLKAAIGDLFLPTIIDARQSRYQISLRKHVLDLRISTRCLKASRTSFLEQKTCMTAC